MKKRLYTSYVYKRMIVGGLKVLVQVQEVESGTEGTKKAKELAESDPGTAYCAGNMWPFVMTKEIKSVVYVDPEDPTKTLKDVEVDLEIESDDEDDTKAEETSGTGTNSATEPAEPVVEAPKAVVEIPKSEPVPEVKTESKTTTPRATSKTATHKPAQQSTESKSVDIKTDDGFGKLFDGAPVEAEQDVAPAGFVSGEDKEAKTDDDETVQELF